MKRILLITALTFVAITSCKKEGCIDTNAENYNSEAKKDDGTCSYEGSIVFWIHADSYISVPNQSVEIFIEGNSIGNMNTSSNYTTRPNCGQGGVTFYSDLKNEKSKIYNYEIKYSAQAQSGWTDYVYKTGSIKVNGGLCEYVEIN